MTAGEFTFGIEEEFFLVHPGSRNAVARVPKLLVRACQRRLGPHVTHELLQSQIEISSPVFTGASEARDEMRRLRREVAAVAHAVGYRLVAAGTHPLAAWTEQRRTEKPRYQALVGDFQILGRRNLMCGMHVHVGTPPGIDRVALMNRAMPWLPLFLALSTSSPFWNRRNTGLLSYRQAAYDEWPRAGIPDFFADEPEYRAFCELLTRAGAIRDPSFLWWAIRPSHRYPTLELRISDSCTVLEHGLAIAALFRCLLRALVRRPELGRERGAMTRRVIDENRWRAKRFGVEAQFIEEPAGTVVDCGAGLEALRALVADDVRALGCETALEPLAEMQARGTSAHRQLARFRELRAAGATRLEALRGVVDWLIEATVPAEPA
jgi:carboxylate-amine ligase